MSERCKTLQEKLQELENKLSHIFSLPAGSLRRHLHSECIQQRFVFLKNLLSAEIASHPSMSSRNDLGHIGKRLAQLEIAFRELEYYQNHLDSSQRSSVGSDIDANTITIASDVCSCDDAGEASIDLSSPELGISSEDELDQSQLNNYNHRKGGDPSNSDEEQRRYKSSHLAGKVVNEGKMQGGGSSGSQKMIDNNPFRRMRAKAGIIGFSLVEKKERRISSSGKLCGALISGITLGMVLMGAAIAIVGDYCSPYSSPPHDSLLFYT